MFRVDSSTFQPIVLYEILVEIVETAKRRETLVFHPSELGGGSSAYQYARGILRWL